MHWPLRDLFAKLPMHWRSLFLTVKEFNPVFENRKKKEPNLQKGFIFSRNFATVSHCIIISNFDCKIMAKWREASFENITIRHITFHVKKAPWWINVNYTNVHTNEELAKPKFFRRQRDCRNDEQIIAFCKEIDETAAHNFSSEPATKRAKSIARERATATIFNEVPAAQLAPATGTKWQQHMMDKYNAVVAKLSHAILNLNFASIYSDTKLVMERKGELTFINDLSTKQTAKLCNQSHALRVYYLNMIKCIARMPWKAKIKTLGNSKRSSIKLACLTCIKMSERTMYRLVKCFESNDFNLTASRQGQHERRWIKNHSHWAKTCRAFIRSKACPKGEPNMKVSDFQEFVNTEIIPNLTDEENKGLLPKTIHHGGISAPTARQWLHHLGCFFKEGKKDIYYDGHEREDVVKYRNEFVPRLLSYFDDPNIVVVFQDEVIYKSFECQTAFWHIPEDAETGELKNTCLRKKGGGYGLMLSGFTTIDGLISLTEVELAEVNARRATKGMEPLKTLQRVTNAEVDGLLGADVLYFGYQLFEYGKNREGYWDAERMVAQTKEIIAVLEFKYPGKTFVFLYDWSSGHDKKPIDAAVVSNMGKKWGGKQPRMRDTIIMENYAAPKRGAKAFKIGEKQSLVFLPGDPPPQFDPTAVDYVGQAKGLAQVAYERGLWRPGMVKHDAENVERSLIHVLGKCADFQQEVMSILKEEILDHGHKCDFLPKFHCELNPIERIWAKSKWYIRMWSDQTASTLKKLVLKSFLPLVNLTVEHVRNFFRHTTKYAESYAKGDTALIAKMSVKKSSHRAVPLSEAFS